MGGEDFRAERRARSRAIARRRRLALLGIAALALVVGVVIGAGGGGNDGDRQSTGSPLPPSCPPEVAADPGLLAGQMLMVRMESQADPNLLRAARRGQIGGVVLFPEPDTAPDQLADEVAELQRAAAKGGAPAPLVAIDQEGGEVKRLTGLPPERAPASIAAGGAAAAEAEGEATGAALRGLGVTIDLAPVVDVEHPDGFLGTRTFGSNPDDVAELATAFGSGLQAEGVAATAKHFPGLGLATANTDLGLSTVEAGRAELERELAPFAAAVDAGFELVMVSNALYPALDDVPAWRSQRLIDGVLREDLGFAGVVISDDLGAGAVTASGYDEGAAAVAAAQAGVDLALFALSDGAAAHLAMRRALRRGELDRERLVASCDRLTAVRERYVSATGSP